VLGTLMSRSGLVMPYRFSVKAFWAQVLKNKVSWFSAVPTHFVYLLNEEVDPEIDRDRLRFSRSASAPLSPEIHRRFEKRFGIRIIETMGLTETGAQILSNPMPPGKSKIGSPGIAVGNEVTIGDDDQNEVPRGTTGEILVRGANVMQGYLHQPEETAKTITQEGWLRTGDLGHMDEDGFVFVTSRIKELIIKGGENIAPREVDEVLLEHESILEAAAFAVPCDQYGQRVEACIRFKPGHSASVEDLLAHCAARLGKFKSPEQVHILDDLPKGPSGKVQRLKLYEMVHGNNA
ncbi:MAG: AMP-binding protein, partial [Rhizobiaceae bacterium]